MKRFNLIMKAGAVVVILVAIKLLVVDRLGLDVIGSSPVITAIVAGVIFTIAIIFSGVLTDYKESEKIPGELAAAIKSIYRDTGALKKLDEALYNEMRRHILELLETLTENFRANRWRLREIDLKIKKVDEDINAAFEKGLIPPLIVKMRNDLAAIDRLIYRVEIIMETDFIPAAYHISIIAIFSVLAILLFSKMTPAYQGAVLFGAVSFVLISLMMLINDMDNPFEYGKNSAADVDLKILFTLKSCLEEK